MKISLARKNLFHEPGRLVISVSGVAFSVMLILILLALYRGWSETLSKYIKQVDAEIWVMQKGSIDMSHSISLLPNQTAEQLREIDDVEKVDYLVGNRISFTINDTEVTTRVIGFDTTSQIGKPVEVIEGSTIPQPGEIIIDSIIHDDHGVNIGDTITLNETEFMVAGIASGGPLFQQSYVPIQDARELFHLQDITNFMVVDIADSASTDQVIEDIESTVSGVDAQTKDEFATNNEKEIMDKFLPIIVVLVIIGFIVGLVIISLTIYTATVEKYREYGVLKAIGATNMYLYKVVLGQSIISGTLGYVIGLALTYFASEVIGRAEPLFVTVIKWQDIGLLSVIVAAMIISATYIPVRRMLSIDPAIVFKS